MITTTTLPNGLTLIIEEMEHVESAAYDLLLPGGLISDAPESVGASLILAELIGRGAGPFDSRGLSEAFDSVGARHGEGVGMDKFALSGAMVADNLHRVLELVSYMVKEPLLPEEEIPNIQSVLLQDIAALQDNPARRSMVELTSRYYPAPFNRSSLGDAEGIKASDRSTMLHLHTSFFRPNRAILSIAGKVKAQEVLQWVTRLFGDWSGEAAAIPAFTSLPPHDYYHIDVESAQMQIVMANPSVRFGQDGYYSGKVAVSLLGASMFGRLFVELREKRGLCYSVFARHSANTSYGTVSAYVGTTPERAQESLDLLLGEFSRLRGTVTEEELNRAKTNLKATLVMGEESPGSRASSNATDWWLLGRVRTLKEISGEVEQVSVDSVNGFLAAHPFVPSSLLTLGRNSLEVPANVTVNQTGKER